MVQKVAAIDVGDLLYFAVLIVGAIYSWVKKTNESKNKQPNTPKPPLENEKTTKNPIDDFLKEILAQSTETKAPIKKVKKEVITKEKPTYTFNEDYFEKKQQAKTNIATPKKIEETNLVSSSINFFNGVENKNLNLRDMIVLDTIFNRPYK